MDQLDSMRVFITVAESGGFAPAARLLRLSPPVVTRAIAALERRLGARLVNRTTRQMNLTEPGQQFLADCKRIIAELQDAEALARNAHVEPQGLLTVTAPVMFGRMHIAPLLLDFLTQHPKVNARAMFVDRLVNLIEEGFDVALRIDQLADSSLTAIKVGTVRRVVVASPAYLAANGAPRRPADVRKHHAIGSGGPRGVFAAPRLQRRSLACSSPSMAAMSRSHARCRSRARAAVVIPSGRGIARRPAANRARRL